MYSDNQASVVHRRLIILVYLGVTMETLIIDHYVIISRTRVINKHYVQTATRLKATFIDV